MIVLDASFVVDVLLGDARSPALRERFFGSSTRHSVPHLIDVEVVSALRRMIRAGRIDEIRARAVIIDLEALPVARHGHANLLPRILDLRERLTAYDATYVALAEALDATLWTCDSGLAQTASSYVEVERF